MDRERLETLFHAAVAAAQPEHAVRAHLPPRPAGRTIVIGAGKASAQMARAFELAWDGGAAIVAIDARMSAVGVSSLHPDTPEHENPPETAKAPDIEKPT